MIVDGWFRTYLLLLLPRHPPNDPKFINYRHIAIITRHHLARRGHAPTHIRGRRIVSDEPTNGTQTLQVDRGDARITINEAGGGACGFEVGVGVRPVEVGEVGVGVEDGIVSLELNDDFRIHSLLG